MNKISQNLESYTTNSAPKEGEFSLEVHRDRKKKREYSKETSDTLAEERI